MYMLVQLNYLLLVLLFFNYFTYFYAFYKSVQTHNMFVLKIPSFIVMFPNTTCIIYDNSLKKTCTHFVLLIQTGSCRQQ